MVAQLRHFVAFCFKLSPIIKHTSLAISVHSYWNAIFSLRQDVGLALVTRETVYPQWNPSFLLICCCQIQTKPSFHTFWGSYNEPSHGGHKIFRHGWSLWFNSALLVFPKKTCPWTVPVTKSRVAKTSQNLFQFYPLGLWPLPITLSQPFPDHASSTAVPRWLQQGMVRREEIALCGWNGAPPESFGLPYHLDWQRWGSVVLLGSSVQAF